MSVREDIKILLAKENLTLTELAKEYSIKVNKKITMDSLSQKLRRSSMKYDEVKLLVESIGYKIEFIKDNK